ncbi:hypothetical protein FGIG_11388 [Fasciola gigantica]|uniref:Uncharacterized protein n=1 Tax=Fasciola gigantica TaxID=46835 RepID=A0A504Z2E7_FASGI|nr:hypothetical protein FGIG_11388 [Fasciola gigantica]
MDRVPGPCAYNTFPSRKWEEALQIQQPIAGAPESRVRKALQMEEASTLTLTRACGIAKAMVAVRETSRIFHATELKGETAFLLQSTTSRMSPKPTRCYL